MIQIQSAEQFTKAAERAKASDLLVQASTIFRQYFVTNRSTGARYTVNFFVRGGDRFGHCTCKGGERNLVCKHLSPALSFHLWVAANRLPTSH